MTQPRTLDYGASPGRHRWEAFVDILEAGLSEVSGADAAFLDTATKRDLLLRMTQVREQISGHWLALIAASAEVAETDGHRDIAAWLAHHTRRDLPATRADLRRAHALEGPWTATGAAVRDGRVNLGQADVIIRALNALPDSEVSPTQLAAAEAHLIDAATDWEPRTLANLGRKVLEVIAPDAHEALDARLLAREEQTAHTQTRLSLRKMGDGTTRLDALIPDAAATRLLTYLEAHTTPRAAHPLGTGTDTGARAGEQPERLPYPHQQGLAFLALLESLDPARLPLHGGDATTLMVTIDYHQLTTDLATAGIGVDDTITASQARRLACTANLIPVVLGGNSEILDLGRKRRLFTPAQRKALALRDRQCRAHGCTIPATWCEAHHHNPWSQGGHTNLNNALLLCSWHHHRAHDLRYGHQQLPNGDIRFTKRC